MAGLAINSVFFLFSSKNLVKTIFHIKIFDNKLLIGAWFYVIAMILVAIYVPLFQVLLKTVPLNLNDWLVVGGLGLFNLIMIECVKYLYNGKDYWH